MGPIVRCQRNPGSISKGKGPRKPVSFGSVGNNTLISDNLQVQKWIRGGLVRLNTPKNVTIQVTNGDIVIANRPTVRANVVLGLNRQTLVVDQ